MAPLFTANWKNESGNNEITERLMMYSSMSNYSKMKVDGKTKRSTSSRKSVEIDLHPEAIGSTSREKFMNQIRVFKEHLAANKGKHGVRLIFINGNGVEDKLRNELIKILKTKASEYSYRDGHDLKYRFHTALEVIVK